MFSHISKRAVYQAFFRVMFITLYIGVMLDVFTTAIGVAVMGNHWESDPLSAALIGNLGFLGLTGLLTGICLVFYRSVRIVIRRGSLRWAMGFNLALTFAVLERWITLGLTLAYFQVMR